MVIAATLETMLPNSRTFLKKFMVKITPITKLENATSVIFVYTRPGVKVNLGSEIISAGLKAIIVKQ